jgi:hypothetical protein
MGYVRQTGEDDAMSGIDVQFARLSMLTKIDRPKWERIIAAPSDIQTLELQNYQDQDWTDPGTPAGQEVLSILALIGTVGGNVSGTAGAIHALGNL